MSNPILEVKECSYWLEVVVNMARENDDICREVLIPFQHSFKNFSVIYNRKPPLDNVSIPCKRNTSGVDQT